MRIRGLGWLRSQRARVCGQLTPGPMVLVYHRVARLPQDPHLLAVTPEHFDEHLLTLRRHYRVVSLSELMEDVARRTRPSPAVVITFDDGYADNAELALPLLRKHGIAATFYLTSGFVGTTREYLQDDLERLLLLCVQCPEQLHLTVGGKAFSWAMRSGDSDDRIDATSFGWNIESKTDPTPRHRAHREIHKLLRAIRPLEREGVLEQLRAQCGEPGAARSTHRAMTWHQAGQMATCKLVTLGAHTVNHPWLAALSPQEQGAEILESKRTLEEQIGRPVSSFAYPYGGRESYTAETMGVLRELGFANACSNFRKRIGGLTDPFQIPRFVVRNWDGDELLRQLRMGRL